MHTIKSLHARGLAIQLTFFSFTQGMEETPRQKLERGESIKGVRGEIAKETTNSRPELIAAIEQGDVHRVRSLLEQGASVEPLWFDGTRYCPFSLALKLEQHGVARLLLEHKSLYFIIRALGWPISLSSMRARTRELILLLLEHGFSNHSVTDSELIDSYLYPHSFRENSSSPEALQARLEQAAAYGNSSKIIKLFRLWLANCQPRIAYWLEKAGLKRGGSHNPDLYIAHFINSTRALTIAVGQRHSAAVRLLLEHGAQPLPALISANMLLHNLEPFRTPYIDTVREAYQEIRDIAQEAAHRVQDQFFCALKSETLLAQLPFSLLEKLLYYQWGGS
jgi:ankyrin repeat protein